MMHIDFLLFRFAVYVRKIILEPKSIMSPGD